MADPLADNALTSIRAIRAVNRARVIASGIKYPRLVTELSVEEHAMVVGRLREDFEVGAALWSRLDEAGRQDFVERAAMAVLALSRGSR